MRTNYYKLAIALLSGPNKETKAVLESTINKIIENINNINSQLNTTMTQYNTTPYVRLLLRIQDLTGLIKELNEQKEFFQDQYFYLFEQGDHNESK